MTPIQLDQGWDMLSHMQDASCTGYPRCRQKLLLEEAKQHGIPVLNAKPKVHCKVFEDNAGAIEIANVPKMDQEQNTSISSTITSGKK